MTTIPRSTFAGTGENTCYFLPFLLGSSIALSLGGNLFWRKIARFNCIHGRVLRKRFGNSQPEQHEGDKRNG